MDSRKIGSFIASQRKQLSMTQQELADKLNLTNRAVSKWETGEGYPDISVLPALAEILNVTVDELLRGEKSEGEAQPESPHDIHESKQQSAYLLENSIRHFTNLYLSSLSIVLAGIIASALGLRLYDHIFLTSLIYALIISFSFLIIGIMFYVTICRNLKLSVEKFNRMINEEKADYKTLVLNKHKLFYALYLIQAVICFGVIPLYPLVRPGYTQAFHKLFGYSSFGSLVIDQNACIFVLLIAYCVLLIIGISVVKIRFEL